MPNTPIPELILTNLETALGAISITNGYFTNVNAVLRKMKYIGDRGISPNITIIHKKDGPKPQSGSETNDNYHRSMDLELELCMEDASEEAPTNLQKFVSDVIRKIQADRQRGGYARWQNIGDVDYVPLAITDPYQVAVVSLSIEYRTKATDNSIVVT